MLKKISLFIYAGMVIMLLVNCKGSDGDAGPAGPKGDTGATGAKGDTASSSSMIFSSGADTTDAIGNLYWIKEKQTANEMKVWNSATIFVFIKSSGVYWPLPGRVNFAQDDDSDLSYTFGSSETSVFAEITQTDWSAKTSVNITPPVRVVEDLRIVVVPGKLMRINADVNWKNYNEVIAALGLSEKDVKISRKISR